MRTIALDYQAQRDIETTGRAVHRVVLRMPPNVCEACVALAVPHHRDQLVDERGRPNEAGEIFGVRPYLRVRACDHNEVGGGRVRVPFDIGAVVRVRTTDTLVRVEDVRIERDPEDEAVVWVAKTTVARVEEGGSP